jgi:hypothetical protein
MVCEVEPQLAQRRDRAHTAEVLVPRLGWSRSDGRRPEGGQPDVVGGGADRYPGAVQADEPGPVEETQSVLDGAFGQPGEADELAGREHLVLTEEGKQVPTLGVGTPPDLENGSGGRSDVCIFCVRARRSGC